MALRPFKMPGSDYTPRNDRKLSVPSGVSSPMLGAFSTPSIARLHALGMKQSLVSENVLKSATLAQLKLLQDEVVTWVGRRQAAPLLRLCFDNVTKRVEVSAVGRHLPASSIQAAWQLASVHEDVSGGGGREGGDAQVYWPQFITFLGLRSPEGEELMFESSDDMAELHLSDWETKLNEEHVYSILYLDSREDMGDLLTQAEREQILAEFDEVDTAHSGVVTTQQLSQWCLKRTEQRIAALDQKDLQAKGNGAGQRMAEERVRLIREEGRRDLDQLMQTDIDDDGTVELHEFFRVRLQHMLVARGALPAPSSVGAREVSEIGDASDAGDTTPRSEFCPRCGKQLLGPFCTGCGLARGTSPSASPRTGSDSPPDRSPRTKTPKKKVVRKKTKGIE